MVGSVLKSSLELGVGAVKIGGTAKIVFIHFKAAHDF